MSTTAAHPPPRPAAKTESPSDDPLPLPTLFAAKLIIEGYVIVPDVVIGPELDAAREGFEALASRLGKRHFRPEEILLEPALLNFVGHPRLMPVIEAYLAHFGHAPVLAWLHLCRDIFLPDAPPAPPFDVAADGRGIPLHNDGRFDPGGVRLSFDVMQLSSAAFLFMDDATPEAGCLIQARGSHHLTRRASDGCAATAQPEFIREHCAYVYPSIRAGSVLIQRGFNFHPPGPPPRGFRRTLRADYTPRAFFHRIDLDGRPSLPGIHQQIPEAALAALPVERRQYFCLA